MGSREICICVRQNYSQTGWSCKLCGGKEDFEQLSDVMEQMELKGQAENLAGRKTLPDTITLLNKGQMAIVMIQALCI